MLRYAFLPVVIDACLRTNATSNGLPISAPNIPLNADTYTFYSEFIVNPLFFNFYIAHVYEPSLADA